MPEVAKTSTPAAKSPTDSASVVVGVDIGGTKVASGIVSASGEILRQTKSPMLVNGDAAAGLAAVVSAISYMLEGLPSGSTLRGIGICSPGPLDPKIGVIINPPNLPCWRDFPLADEVAKLFGVPVKVDNDANAAALAETVWGAGRGYKNVFYATIGTGIGTGIILDGRIFHGRTGSAGEGGHMSIDFRGEKCGCGKPGCIEVLASGPAIGRRARARVAADAVGGATMLQLAGGQLEKVTSETVGLAFYQGDPLAKEVLRETVELLALWLGNMVDLLDPDIIILGGGVAALLAPYFDAMRDLLPSYCVNPHSHEIPLLAAHYGADSGIAGGAALCAEVLARP